MSGTDHEGLVGSWSSWPTVVGDPPADREGLHRQSARGLLLLAVVGVVVAVVLVLVSWPRGELAPAVQPPVVPGTAAPAAPVGGVSSPAIDGSVVVDVAGEVRHPGVRELPAGSRVTDAIDAAGGLTRRADTSALNLARVLVDGEQVLVGASGAGSGVPGSETSATPLASGTSLVSINTATSEQLDLLPGIGPVLAQAIIDYRTQNGPFATIEQLLEVSGIGDATYADLQALVTL